MRIDTQLKTAIDRFDPADAVSSFVVNAYHWIENDEAGSEVVVGRIFGYVVPRYDRRYTLFNCMDGLSESLKSTYEEIFLANDDGELLKPVLEQMGDDADCWDQLIVMSKVVMHPSLGDAKKKVLYRTAEQFGGTSLVLLWGLHCTLFDHELSDLGFKPLKTSDDMWAHWTGCLSPFAQKDPDSVEAPEVRASVQDWVNENWPWSDEEWPHMN